MQSEPQKTTNITTYAYDILSPGELQTYLPAWRSVFVVSELSRRKTVQTDSSGTIRYRNEIRPLIPPAQEKSEAEKLLWKYMGQLTDNLKEQIAPQGKDAGTEYFPPDFPADIFSQSNWKILTLEPEAHDKIPGLIKTWKAVLRPVLEAFAEITILGVTLTKKIFLPIEGATLTVRFAGNLVTDLDLASPIALKTTRKTEPLKIAAANLVYVTSEAILEMLEFGFRIVDGGLRVREMRGMDFTSSQEDNAKPTKGIFITGLENKEQANQFIKKFEYFAGPSLNYWVSDDEKEYVFHTQGFNNSSTKQGQVFEKIFNDVVIFINKPYGTGDDQVDNYDKFQGSQAQWICIDQFNFTEQKYYFIYALTHAAREFLHAKEKEKNEYIPMHNLTLHQDLLILNDFCREISKNDKFSWYDNIQKNREYIKDITPLKGGSLVNPSMIITEDGSNLTLIKYYTKYKETTGEYPDPKNPGQTIKKTVKVGNFTKLELVDLTNNTQFITIKP